MPWERDELWAPFISTRSPWRWRRGARREMGLSLSRAWPGTGIPCERCLRPGHQGPRNPGPGPAPLAPGGPGPRTSPFRPQNPGSQSLRPIQSPSQGFTRRFQGGGERVPGCVSRTPGDTGRAAGGWLSARWGGLTTESAAQGSPDGSSHPRLPGTGGFRGPGTFSGKTRPASGKPAPPGPPRPRPDAHPALGGRDLRQDLLPPEPGTP